MRIHSLFLVALMLTPALAQRVPSAPTLLALGGRDQVTLRLPILDTGLPEGGYKLVRRGPGGERTLTSAPLNTADAAKRFAVDPEAYDLLLGGLRALRTAKPDERGLVLLNVLAPALDPKAARAAGLLLDDPGLAPGAYTYTLSAGGRAIAEIRVQVGRDEPLAVPPAPKAALSPNTAALTWPRGDASVIAYRVQRAEEQGAFSNLTASPRLVNRGETPRFTDTRVRADRTYRYRVVAVDVFGRESAPSPALTVEGADTVPLVPPVAVARGGEDRVDLAWAKVTDKRVKSVVVLRGDRPNTLAVLATLPATATTYTDTTAAPGRHHFYALKVTTGERESAASLDVPGRAYNTTPPNAPRGLKVTAGEHHLDLSWSASPEKDLRGYLVYREEAGLKDDGQPRLVLLTGAPLATTTYRDPIPQGVQHTFRYVVKAVNTSGVTGAASEAADGRLTDKSAPDAPTLLRATPGAGRVALVFTQPPTLDLKAFEVYRAAPGDAAPTKIATLPPDSVGLVDAGVRGGATWAYAVVALDASGNASRFSNVLDAAPFAPTVGAPGGVKADVTGGRTRVTWEAVPNAIGYVVLREAAGRRVQVAGPLAGRSFEETTVPGARYAVRALGPDGTPGAVSAFVAP